METPRDNSRAAGNRAEDAVLTTPEGHALPRVLDPVVTLDLVQRYVETERARSRRLLALAGTIFLLVVLVLLTVFVSIGIYVLRNSRRAAQIATDAKIQAIGYGVEMVNISNQVDRVASGQKEIKNEVQKVETSRVTESRVLKSDLVRFSNYVANNDRKGERSIAGLEASVKDMQKESAARVKELAAMKEQYAVLLTRLSGLASAGPDSVSSPEARRPLTGADEPDKGLGAAAADLPPGGDGAGAEEPVIEPRGDPQGEISVVTLPSGDRYEGEFKDGLMSGWGAYTYRNGDKYEGEFRDDMKNGKGTFAYRSGDKYLGEFKDDMKQGRGSYQFRNGDKYVGEFKSDMIAGKGTLVYQNGNQYAGDFRNGLKSGNGVFRFSNGDVYEGEFKDDTREGRGTYVFGDGTKYIGDFKGGQRHGKGRYIYPGGEEYVGDFRNGKKEGNGVCIYPNGKRLNGLWKEDKLVKGTEG